MSALVGMVACVGGCSVFTAWERQQVEDSYVRDGRASLIRLRKDVLPGTAEVLPSGEIGFALDVEAACQSIPVFHTVHEIEEHSEMSALGKVSIGVGILATLVSLAGVGTVTGEYCSKYGCNYGPHLAYTSTPAALLGIAGIALAMAPFLVQPTGGARNRVREEAVDDTITSRAEATVGVSCGDARSALRAIGELVLVTPGGPEIHARPDASGLARFPVDWTTQRSPATVFDDPGTWRFVAAHPNLELTWEPTATDREKLAALIQTHPP